MSDDLVEHLRNPNHAQAPTLAESMMKQAAARIEALEAERYQLIADLADMKGRALKAESRADAAESAYGDLTTYIEGWTSPSEMKQRAGEMTAQEVRTVQAILSAILDKARSGRAFVQQHEGKK